MAIKIHNSSELQYEGRVVTTFEKSGYDWCTSYAVVYSPDENGNPVFSEVSYWTDLGYSEGWAQVDAPAEVIQAYREMKREEQRVRDEAAYRTSLVRGAKVRVVAGRKIPVGTEAEVFWFGPCKFSYGKKTNVGLLLESGEKVFTSKSNVERV